MIFIVNHPYFLTKSKENIYYNHKKDTLVRRSEFKIVPEDLDYLLIPSNMIELTIT